MNTSLHILVVDDRPDTVLFLTEFLLSRDHRVETCSNGNEALEAIVRRHRTANTYDLLISDVSMPGMDGITLLKEIRRRQLLLPVALYTAFGSMHTNLVQEAHQHDCIAVLDKPIELRRIDTLLSNVIARRDGTHHQEKDQPFFGTSRVARPSPVPGAIPSTDMGTGTTGSKRRETAHPDDARGQIPNSYALEPKPSPLSLPIQPLPELPIPPPPIRTPSPYYVTPTEPLTGSMPSFRVKSPHASNPVPSSVRTVNPAFRTPLPFLQSNTTENNPSMPPIIPPMVASARVMRTPLPIAPPIASGSEETDSPPPTQTRPTTAFIRRGVSQTSSQGTGSTRRGNDPANPEEPVSPPISPQTARLRRSVTGTYVPGTASLGKANPPTHRLAAGNQSSRAVACAHCHKVFMVAARNDPYTAVCVHCAQLNRIDPL